MKQIELVEKRKPREKHFLQEDGTIVATIFDKDIHYLDNGKYEEIDNQLIKEGDYYINKKNAYKVKFADKDSDELMKLEVDNYFLNMSFIRKKIDSISKNSNMQINREAIKYNNIIDNVDIEYKVLPTKVKDSIIIKDNKDIPEVLSFQIDTNLSLVLNDNNNIDALDNEKLIFKIEPPYMIDASGNINNNIAYKLTKNDKLYQLDLLLDLEWLNDKDTTYPVIIDPTITNSQQVTSLWDTYIYPGDTGVSRGTEDILKAGVERKNNTNVINRTLIRFDIPDIGTGSQIIDATLNLIGYPAPYDTYDTDIIEVHRVTTSWDENQANWSTMNDKYDARVESCFRSFRSIRYIDDSVEARKCVANITDIVKKWYVGTDNFGLMLKQSDETHYSTYYPAFFSKNNTVLGDNPQPLLKITYRNQNGLESYMKYVTQGFSIGNSYVNVYNGNLVTSFDLGSTVGGKFPVNLKLIYNTNDVVLNNDIGYGKGFRLNFSQSIKSDVDEDNNTFLTYIDDDGTIHYFYSRRTVLNDSGQSVDITEENTYFDEDGLELKIVVSTNKYQLIDKYGLIKEFTRTNNNSYLSKIISTNGGVVTINVNSSGLITSITDADNKTIGITYSSNNLVVTSPVQVVTLNKTSNKITGIVNNLGTITFNYNNNNIITSIVDIDGKTISYEYYSKSPYRVRKVLEYGNNNVAGNYIEFIYNYCSTTMVDNKNRATTLTFNQYGNIESTTNLKSEEFIKNAFGITNSYGSGNQEKNKLLQVGLPIVYVKNYIDNSSFEPKDLVFDYVGGMDLSLSDDCSYSDHNCLKVVCSDTEGYIFKYIDATRGDNYTYELYLKNSNKVKLGYSYIASNYEIVEVYGNTINANSVFNRYTLNINYPADAVGPLVIKVVPVTTGTFYIDDVQLSNGSTTYIENSSFNDVDFLFSTVTSATLSISDDCANSGHNSLKVDAANAYDNIYKQVSIPKGHDYTFSVYLKNDCNVTISMDYTNANNELIESVSEIITPNTEFSRYDVTINYPSNALGDLYLNVTAVTTGTFYIDDVQLEIGEIANSYNYLYNSDFSDGYTGWSLSANSDDGSIVNPQNVFDIVTLADDITALKIQMSPMISTGIGKRIYVSGVAGDSYTLSFWYKNKGIISSDDNHYNCSVINFEYKYGQCSFPSFNLNPNNEEWQYFSYTFYAEHDYTALYLSIFESFDANELYLTNISLFKNIRDYRFMHDMNGNVVAAKQLNESVSSFEYDSNNELVKITDSKGKNSSFEYDNIVTNRVLNEILYSGISRKKEYDNYGNSTLIKEIKDMKDTINDGYYKLKFKGTNKFISFISNQVCINNDDSPTYVWEIQRITNNDVICYKIKNPIITDSFITYSNDLVTLSDGSTDNSLFIFETKENGSFNIKAKQSGKYLFNNNNSLAFSAISDSIDSSNFEVYIIEDSNQSFKENDLTYSSDNKFIKSLTNSLLAKKTYEVDQDNGLITSLTDTDNRTINYSYNNKNQLVTISDGETDIDYEYNSQNLLSKIITNGKYYKFDYDDFQNLYQVKTNNSPLLTNNYDSNNGELSSVIYGNNQTVNYYYDDYERLIKIINDTDTFDIKYDNKGGIAKVLSNNMILKYNYDNSQRLLNYNFNDLRIKYTYDTEDNITRKLCQSDDINLLLENEYNTNGDLLSTVFGNNMVNYAYDSLDRLVSRNINNLYNISYNYISNGKRTSDLISSVTINGSDIYKYKYDKRNNITHIYRNNVLINKYYYDNKNQLIRTDNFIRNITNRYKYDQEGNILYKKTFELNTFNLLNQNKYKYESSTWCDLLTNVDNKQLSYDSIGNLISIGNNINIIWKNGKQLYQYSDGTNTFNYKYNKEGIRTSKKINNTVTNYYLEGDKILFEKTNNTIIKYIYNSIDNLIGFEYNNTMYYYEKNILNDIVGILDSNLNLIARYVYDDWGNILSIEDGNGNDISGNNNHVANINPFRYRSYYYDKETSMYYLNFRYYNPEFCRFISSDINIGVTNLVTELNMYSYATNNPINYEDTTGSWPVLNRFTIKAALAVAKSTINKALKSISDTFKNKAEASGNITEKKQKVTSGNFLGVEISSYETTNVTSPTIGKTYNVYGNIEHTYSSSGEKTGTSISGGLQLSDPTGSRAITVNIGNDDNYVAAKFLGIQFAWGYSLSNKSLFVSYTQSTTGPFIIAKAYETRMDISDKYLYAFGFAYAGAYATKKIGEGASRLISEIIKEGVKHIPAFGL